jgi:uncharacterized protein involved in exopolysaccharide biosynthesis
MAGGGPVPGGSFVGSWYGIVRRRWRVGALVFVLVAGGVAALLLLSRPIYRSEARLRLGEPPPMAGVSPTGGLLSLMRMGGDPFANDLELLSSRTVTEAVVLDAALAVTLDAPRGWYRDSLLAYLGATRGTQRAAFEAEWLADGRVRVRRTAPRDSAIGDVAAGDTLEFGGVRIAFLPWREGMPRRIRIRTLPFGEAVRRTRTKIVAERARRDANVVDLSFQHKDPGLTEAVVAAVVNRFIELRAAVQRRESGETVDSLRRVAENTERELAAAEAALEVMQRTARLVAPDAQGEAFIERYTEIAAELEVVRVEQAAIRELLEKVETARDPVEAWSGLAALPRFLDNPTVGELLGRLAALQTQRADLAWRRAAESRALQVLDEQIASIDASLRSLATAYASALDRQERELATRLAEMDAELAGMPRSLIDLARRQREIRILSEILVLTEQRLRQEELRQALTFSNVQVIDPPALRYRPVWPRKKLGFAVALLLGMTFSVLGMVVAERADRTLRSAAEVRQAVGVPVVAVAVAERDGLAFALEEARAVLAAANGAGGPRGARLTLAAVDEAGLAAEAARALGAAFAREQAERRGAETEAPLVLAAPTLDRFSGAAAAAAEAAPVVLVLRHGRTTRDAAMRAAALLRETGGELAGAVLVCARAKDTREVWS